MLAPTLLVEEDVRRLHVAVDEPERMRGVEGVRDLPRDRDRASRLEGALATQQRLQVGSVDVPHRDEEASFRLARLVHRDDVRMVEAGRESRLAQKPFAEAGVIGEPLEEDLQATRRPSRSSRAR